MKHHPKNNIMRDKVCMITGATSGIGLATAHALAEKGAEVIVVGRNPVQSALAVEQIKDSTHNDNVRFLLADLSSQAQIHDLVEDFTDEYDKLDVLINNAGAMFPERQESVDGLEMTFAVNHLAYFLLTNLMLPVLTHSASARVVNVASGMQSRLMFSDLQNQHNYSGWDAYAQSKFANILFTYELARRISTQKITANVLNPGVVKTNLYPGNLSPEEGAKTSVYLATSPEVEGVSGDYFYRCRSAQSSPETYNVAGARQLWKISEALTDAVIPV